MFVGREAELNSLNRRYNSGQFELLPIYGRRRVGKTSLIKEFIKDKKAIFFSATESAQSHNLRFLSISILEAIGVPADVTYNSFDAAFEALYSIAQREKLVFVIDEYPYLAQSYPAISSILQVFIDHKLKDTDMMIILCGSSMSFMENQVLGYKSPLYGRRTGQYKIEAFEFATAKLFFPNFAKQEQAVAYGVSGGIPKYLEMFNNKHTLKENIIDLFLRSDALLFEEPSNLLKQELREPQTYNDILTAIASGASKISEIVTKSGILGFDSSKCSKYLISLMSLGIVKKETPYDAVGNKKSIYRLNDGMFRFWYRFVRQHITKIQLGLGEAVYSQIEDLIPGFMGEVFEDICIQWLWSEYKNERAPIEFRDCGRWWGNNPNTKTEQEIDILAVDLEKKKALFCECKWTSEKVGIKVLNDLIDKSSIFAFEDKYYIVFSKSGFTAELRSCADENIRLISFDEM